MVKMCCDIEQESSYNTAKIPVKFYKVTVKTLPDWTTL